MRVKRIKEMFNYYKGLILQRDIFDPTEDEREINELALSALRVELEIDKSELRRVLSL